MQMSTGIRSNNQFAFKLTAYTTEMHPFIQEMQPYQDRVLLSYSSTPKANPNVLSTTQSFI